MSDERAILLVDDDETVQEFGAMALSSLDRDVIVAAGGAECLEAVARRPDSIGLVVLDMLMPGMDGREVAAKLREAGFEAPILLCSGYDMSPADVAAAGATAFLSKPYRMRQLTDAAKALLDG